MESEDLRIAVYDRFRSGHIPTVAVLADDLAVPTDQVSAGLQTLADQRHLALGSNGEITMAHPFTAIPLGFSVMGQDTLWWGGCAWDSFAIPHLLPDQSPGALRRVLGAPGLNGVSPDVCVQRLSRRGGQLGYRPPVRVIPGAQPNA